MLLFLDLETTGFSPENDTIIEIAAARWDGEKIIATYQTLIQLPQNTDIPEVVQHLTGITPEMCQHEGIPIEKAIKELHEFLQPDDIITGHNISFDTGFLKANGVDIVQQEIDTFILSLLVLGQDEESHSLEVLSEKYGLMHTSAHRAMSDVEANIGLYELMQIFWAHNFSQSFFDFLEQKTDTESFPELYFFKSTQDKKEELLQQQIPFSSFAPFQQEWNKKTESMEKVFETIQKKENAVFWETNTPNRNILELYKYAKKANVKIAFLYPDDKQRTYIEFFDAVQKEIDEEIGFLGDIEKQIDQKKWKEFVQKKTYSRAESIVLVKTQRAKEKKALHKLRFMNEEWSTARSLFTDTKNIPLPNHETAVFAPFSYAKKIPKDYICVVLEGERIEDIITDLYTQKQFSKRWIEDLPEEKTDDINAFIDIIQKIAVLFRKEKGENPYTLPIPYSQAKYIGNFPLLWKEAASIIQNSAHSFFNPWKIFFADTMDENMFFQIDLFPDNYLAFSAKPIDILEYTQEIIRENTIVMGDSFPWKDDSLIFSFDLPKNTSIVCDQPPTFLKFNTPTVSRSLTPAELSNEVIQEMETGENIVCSVNSKKVGEEVTKIIKDIAQEKGYTVFSQSAGSVGKMRVQIPLAGKKILIAVPRYLDILRVEDFDFTRMVIARPMFDPPKNPFLSKRREQYHNDFEDFSIPRALARYTKELRRIPELQSVFFGDGRAGDSNSWMRVFWRGV